MSYQQSGLDRHIYYQYINQIYHVTNDERQKHGVPPVNLHQKLSQAAQRHSEDMAQRRYFSHRGANNSTPADRVAATGYAWSLVAENISSGNASPWEVVQGWMDSPGHRANIVNPELQEIGIGVCYVQLGQAPMNIQYYWTQLFATPSNR